MKYKVILLDADDTLFDYDQAETYALMKTYAHFNKTFNIHELERYKRINKEMWINFEKGIIDIKELRSKRFEKLFFNEPISPDEVSDIYLEHLGEACFEHEGAKEVCEVLSSRYELVILTNGMAKVQQSRLRRSRLMPYIKAIITSEETGYKKPDAAIFEYALKQVGHKDKKSVLMAGDSLSSDIQGGINAGIDTCWYNFRHETNTTSVHPVYEIKELKELLCFL